MANVTKSNAYNWAGGGPQSGTTPISGVARFFRYKSFKGNAKKDGEDDEGYTGQRNITQGYDVTTGTSEPEIEDKIRPDEIVGDVIRGCLGSCTSEQQEETVAYEHTFEESDDGDLPALGYYQGFNVGSGEDAKPKRFDNCIVSKLEFKFSTKETPTFTASHAGDLPIFGITEPTLVYAYPRITPILATHVRVYLDALDGTIGSTLMAGWMEGGVTIDNQIDSSQDMGTAFGKSVKDMGALKVEGDFKRRHISTDLQRQFITGSPTGTTPIAVNEEYQLRYEATGVFIKDAEGADTIYPYKFRLDLPYIVITENEPSEEGDGPKTYDIKWKAMPDDTGATVSALLQNKVTTYAAV